MQEQSTKSKYVRRFYNGRTRHWQFPFVFMALICLIVSPIYAASFDCKKAATEMEKTICSNPALSQLDDKLAAAYREALEKVPQKGESLREGQRQWLIKRNSCTEALCIENAYKARLADLKLIVSGAASEKSQQGTDPSKITATAGEVTKKYPPYPDIWGCELPWPDRGADVFIYKMPKGDFMVTYSNEEKGVNKDFIKYFFSGEQKILTKEEYRFIHQRKSDGKYNISLKNGEELRFVFNAGGECTNYFTDIYFKKTDKTGRVVFKKMAFYLHDVVKKVTFLGLYELRKCAGKGEMLMRLENVGNGFVPLDDGTFLLTNGAGGFILRFDKDLNTKSELLNKKVYLIDRDVFVKNYLNKYRVDNSAKSYQSLHDELLKYFTSLK